jgi:hypothetical protein
MVLTHTIGMKLAIVVQTFTMLSNEVLIYYYLKGKYQSGHKKFPVVAPKYRKAEIIST